MNSSAEAATRTAAALAALCAALLPAPVAAQQQPEDLPQDPAPLGPPLEGEEAPLGPPLGPPLEGEEEAPLGPPLPPAAEEEEEEGGVNPMELDRVIITDEELARLGGSATVLGEAELEAVEADDPHEILRRVPGVFARGEDGFGLRPNIGIRGANSERSSKVALLEDGVLFGPAPYSAPAAYYFPIMTRMIGVEILKGPAAIVYGPNTVGGAINFQTRPVPLGPAAMVDVSGGSFLTGRLHSYAGWGGEYGGVLLEGVHWRSDGFKTIDGAPQASTGFEKNELMLKARLNSDPHRALWHVGDLKVGWASELSQETYLGLSEEDFRADPYRRYLASRRAEMDWDRLQLQLRYSLLFRDGHELQVTAYRHHFDRAWTKLNRFHGDAAPSVAEVLADPDSGARRAYYDVLTGADDSLDRSTWLRIGPNQRSFVSQGVQARYEHVWGGASWSNLLEAGLRLHQDQIERLHTERPYAVRGGRLELAEPERAPIRTADNTGWAVALAGHVRDQWSWQRLTVAPGLRLESIWTSFEDRLGGAPASSEDHQLVVIPGIGANMEIWQGLSALAGVHRGFSPRAPGGAEGVEPEISINAEAGLRYLDPEAGTLLDVVGFYNAYSNLSGQCTFSAGCVAEDLDQQFNAGEVDIWGVEALFDHRFDLGSALELPLRIAYTYTDSSFATAFTSFNPQLGEVEVGDRLPYIPRHQLALRLGLEAWQRLEANLAATYVGEALEQAGRDGLVPQTDAWVSLSALVRVRVWEELYVYGRGDNLLGVAPLISRRPYGARPGAPRLLQLGVRWEL